ncbi:MAG: hypothetical protein ACI85I_000051 [Arenicella sp.]|jgi:hypothetical protein
MKQEDFWGIIEKSWEDSPQLNELRKSAIKTNDESQLDGLSGKLENDIKDSYIKRLSELDKDALTDFIHILEERIYHIDRQEIHTYTDGSDDGFLYCRCFILGMGRDYYNMIDNTPSRGKFDLEAEGFGFSAYQVFENLFGEEFDRNSKCSIESCSNQDGWKE